MKKLSTLFLALVSITYTYAQSFELRDTSGNVVTNQTLNVTNPGGDIYNAFEADVHVKNISATAKQVKCKRIVMVAPPAAMSNYFCWTICYGPNTNVSPTAENINAGASNTKFHGYVNPNGVVGNASIRYVFYDINNTSDSVYITVNYTATTTTALNVNKLSVAVSNVYPNPSNGNAFVKINDQSAFNGKTVALKIYNMLGKEMGTKTTTAMPETIAINSIADLPSGIYFLTVLVDSKTIATKRFTID
ncbi:MAG: T9SS type A sorting domain-containing protein [Bacteroidia bacterium]